MAAGPHISLSAETIFTIGGFPITNSILTSVVISSLLILFAVAVRGSIKQTDKPTGVQNTVEAIIEAFYSLIQSVTQNHKKTAVFFPFITTFFFFILLNNWTSILPGVGTIGIFHQENEVAELTKQLPKFKAQAATEEDSHSASDQDAVLVEDHADDSHDEGPTFVPVIRPGSADLNTTLALGIFSVLATQYIGVRYLNLGYFKKFINFSSPIMFIVGILETISEFAKIISFAFRLFGNIFAGEVLLVVIAYISGSYLFFAPLPFYGLEVFVGFIQALVFSMLTLVFFNMATISHDEH